MLDRLAFDVGVSFSLTTLDQRAFPGAFHSRVPVGHRAPSEDDYPSFFLLQVCLFFYKWMPSAPPQDRFFDPRG